jgi:hypothetical protein
VKIRPQRIATRYFFHVFPLPFLSSLFKYSSMAVLTRNATGAPVFPDNALSLFSSVVVRKIFVLILVITDSPPLYSYTPIYTFILFCQSVLHSIG